MSSVYYKVGVNGFGTIGRRVALAVTLQKDMRLVGVVKRTPDYAALYAASKGIPLTPPHPGRPRSLRRGG